MAEAYKWAEKAVGARGKIAVEVIQNWRSGATDNYSNVTVRGYIALSSGGPSADNTNNCKSSFSGSVKYGPFTTNFNDLYASQGWRKMLEWTGNLGHAADGTLNIYVDYSFGPTITTNLGSGGTVTSGWVALWSIARGPARMSAPSLTYIPPNSIKVDWTAPAQNGGPIDKYAVLWDKDNPPQDGTANFGSANPNGSARSYTITGLDINSTYYVSTDAHNAYGWSPGGRSPTTGLTIGNVPAATKISTISTTPPNNVRLVITPPAQGGSPIVGYDVEYWNDDVPQTIYSKYFSGTGTTLDLTVDAGYTWVFRVAAKNSQGFGPYGAPKSILVLGSPRVLLNGTWRNTEAYVRYNGVWKLAVPYVKVNGVWKTLA